MEHLDPVDGPNPAPSSTKPKEKDPVCGMDVNRATARHKTLHKDKEYFFCSAGCLAKFEANPEKILSSPLQPMKMTATPLLFMPAPTRAPEAGEDARAYLCPMCPEVPQVGLGPCPKWGMSLDPESPVPA